METEVARRGLSLEDATSRPAQDSLGSLTWGEALVVGAIAVVAGTAWLSLILAHLGVFHAWVALGVPVVATTGVALRTARRGFRPSLDRSEFALLGLLIAVAAAMFFPGFRYAVTDKDPGVYVAHAFAIEREGSYAFHDPTLADDLPMAYIAGTNRRPGVWIDDRERRRITLQFYHLFPAVMATALGIGGTAALFSCNGLLATIALLGIALAVKRVFGPLAAWTTSAILVSNMIEVWNARYPTTEILTQFLFVGALLCLVLSLETAHRSFAGLAGGLTGIGFLARPDGLLLVLMAVGLGCILLAFRRFGSQCRWFALGLGLTVPHGLVQAYIIAWRYTEGNHIPPLSSVAGFVILAVFSAGASRLLLAHFEGGGRYLTLRRRLSASETQRMIGLGIVVLATAGLTLALLRPHLFGKDYAMGGFPTLDEINLYRLAFFFTPVGLAAMWIGVAVVSLSRWRTTRWVLVGPGLILMPVYLWHARVHPQLMWWTRRFVPVAVVTIAVLAGVALAWAINRRTAPKVVPVIAVALTVLVVIAQLRMSLPLRRHHEFEGTYEAGREIATAAGPANAVVLFTPATTGRHDPTNLFVPAVWMIHGGLSTIIPSDPTPNDLAAYVREFPDRPILLVIPGTTLPPRIPPSSVQLVRIITRSFPLWEEHKETRPERATSVSVDLSVWKIA